MNADQPFDFIITDYQQKFKLLGLDDKQILQAFAAASTLTNARLLKHIEAQSEQTRKHLEIDMAQIGKPSTLEAFQKSEASLATLHDDDGNRISDLFLQWFTENIHKLFLSLETTLDTFLDQQKQAEQSSVISSD